MAEVTDDLVKAVADGILAQAVSGVIHRDAVSYQPTFPGQHETALAGWHAGRGVVPAGQDDPAHLLPLLRGIPLGETACHLERFRLGMDVEDYRKSPCRRVDSRDELHPPSSAKVGQQPAIPASGHPPAVEDTGDDAFGFNDVHILSLYVLSSVANLNSDRFRRFSWPGVAPPGRIGQQQGAKTQNLT